MTEANTPESLEHLGLPQIDQVGFVVKSLEDAKARYGALFGPFTEMDGSVEAAEYRGEIADAHLGILFGKSGELEMEFIELGREGMHHIRYRVDNADEWIAKLAPHGYKPIWYKQFAADTVFAYLEREGDPLLVEFLEMPAGGPGTSEA